ncbi:MAG TPA: POTRA domain-containing protein [Polyangiales bacterium]|nr:POTRA domain-containing protein [Polyangiales bacterium]
MLSWLERRLWRWLPLAWIAAATSSAQAEIPDYLQDQRVVAVRVQGDNIPGGPGAIGVRIGASLSRQLVRDAVLRLLAQGRWLNVQVDAEPVAAGVALVFHLQPRIVLRRVEVRGADALDEQVARDALGVTSGSTLASDSLDSYAAAVRKAYAERGYLGARADVRLRDTDDAAQKVLMVELDEGPPTLIDELVFSGQAPPNPNALFASMGLSIGAVLDRRAMPDAVARADQRLRSTGYLEAELDLPVITVKAARARLSFPAHIGPRYRFEVQGASPLAALDVVSALSITEQPLNNATLETLPPRVRDFFVKHGYLDAKASVQRSTLPGGRASLTIRVQPGPQVEVVAVSFLGAEHFNDEFLRDQLTSYLEDELPGTDLVETVDSEVVDLIASEDREGVRQVPRPWSEQAAATFYPPLYEQAIKHITELYQAAGYLAVEVGPLAFERLGPRHATVNIPVREGPRSMLHGVVLTGTKAISSRELLVASGLKDGDAFSYLGLEEARLRMQAVYQEHGHMFVRIEPSVRFSNDRTRAEVSFQVVEGYPVRVGDVVVQGAERTSPLFIRRLLDLRRGSLFQPSKARESEATLQALGVFTGVSVGLQDPELPARVKTLLITVSERPNQSLDFSAGLSTGQGIRAGFEYGYRNLFGSAVGVYLRVQFAYQLLFPNEQTRKNYEALLFQERLERNIGLGLTIPRLPGMGSTRTNLDLVHVRDNETDFGLDKNAISLAFTETPLHHVTLLEAADLENNNVDLFNGEELDEFLMNETDPRLRRLLRVPEGASTLVALRGVASYDRRDNAFVPTSGYFISVSSELAMTISTEDPDPGKEKFFSRFLKLQLTTSAYVPFGKFVLAGQLRVGRILHLANGSKTYPNRSFYLGGVDTMRGYFQDELVPQDLVSQFSQPNPPDVNTIVRGGDAFVLVRAELRFPLYGQLGGGLFADIGNLWADAANMNPINLRPTAGAGLRLNTPVGPIAVDYGIVILRRPELQEPFGTLQFTVGLF